MVAAQQNAIDKTPEQAPEFAQPASADKRSALAGTPLQTKVCDPQRILKGIAFPINVKFRSLLISGPPGSGKSTLARKLGGWSEEGYVDLARHKWWTAETLSLRPREIHLGFPFKGFSDSLTVFDEAWLQADPTPELDFQRICIPPEQKYFFSGDWLTRYAFEFLLPPPEDLLVRRQHRALKGTHKVDINVNLEHIKNQLLVFQMAAVYLRSQNIKVHLRENVEGPPLEIINQRESKKPSKKPAGNRMKSWIRAGLSRYIHAKRIRFRKDYFLLGEKIIIDQQLCSLQITLANGKILQLRPQMKLVANGRMELTGRYCLADPNASRQLVRQYLVLAEKESVTLDPNRNQQISLLNLPEEHPHRHLTIGNKDQCLVIHNPSYTYPLKLKLLPAREAQEQFIKLREKRLRRLKILFGGRIELLSKKTAFKLIRKINSIMEDEVHRPLNDEFRPGGVVELPADRQLFVIGDLHGKPDNLLGALTHSSLLEALERGRASLVILGDAVHPDGVGALDDMSSSMLIMDLIFKLKVRFPEQLFYLRGNHDSFSEEIAKGGVPQGLVWAKQLSSVRGKAYRQQMQHFYDLLPYVAVSEKAVICHAGPPVFPVNYEMMVNIQEFPRLKKELLTNRVKRKNQIKGYIKLDANRFRQCLKVSKTTPLIVGHTPIDMKDTVWANAGHIANHFIVYSSHEQWTGTMAQTGNEMHPMVYPNEPLTRIINSMPDC